MNHCSLPIGRGFCAGGFQIEDLSQALFSAYMRCLQAGSPVFYLVTSWSGVCEEAPETVGGSQPADQHQRTEGCLHITSPELLTQPPGKCGRSGEQSSAQYAGPEGQQPD